MRIRTSSAINPQSRSNRIRGNGFSIPRVLGCILLCVFVLQSQRPFGFLLESDFCIALGDVLFPLVPRKIQIGLGAYERYVLMKAIVGVDSSAPLREWRAGFLLKFQVSTWGRLFREPSSWAAWGFWWDLLGSRLSTPLPIIS